MGAPTHTATRPPRAANVVRDPQDWSAAVDWTHWYLTDEEDMGEGTVQGDVIVLLRSVLTELCSRRSWRDAFVGHDNFFAWVEDHPLVRVSPDVYLLRGAPPPPPFPGSWQLWRPGHRPPEIAFEVVSERWRKDYEDNPEKYAQLGVRELCIFDPAAGQAPGRHTIQLYRCTEDGAFVLVHAGAGPVDSQVLAASLVQVATPGGPRLRLAWDSAGTSLVPSVEESRDANACERDAERASRERAEARLAALQAELDALRERGGG